MKRLVIALDFDDTLTADPELFRRLVDDALNFGHLVYIVTARRDTQENRDEISQYLAQYQYPDIPAIYTGLTAKKLFMDRRGILVDIWVDDNPEAIVHGM